MAAGARGRTAPRRRAGAAALTVSAALVLAGCNLFGGGATDGEGDGGASSGGHITIQSENFAHIDPHTVSFGMWLLQQGVLEGLVLQTLDGTDVRPGVAQEWEVSEDGMTYTFHLNPEASWSNGEPVTADDFTWTYERLLDPDRGAGGPGVQQTTYQARMGIENATAFNSGEVEDFDEVGVKAIDESTLEFTLEAPNPGFLMGLTHPSLLPLYPEAVESEDDWQQPENWVGNGPYNLTDWVANSSMRLERNEEYWDAENVALDSIDVQLIEQGSINTTVPYENGEVDIQDLSEPAQIATFINDPELADQLYVLENSSTHYLTLLRSRNTVLEDPQIRSALSLGLGREEIAGISETNQPASTLVSPLVPGWDESIAAHDQMWGEEAVAEGQRLLAEAGYPDGEGLPTINLLAAADFPELDAMVDTWQTNLGITVNKDVVEAGVYVERRAELHEEDYVGFWYGSFGGLSTWSHQVQQLWNPTFTREFALNADGYAQYLEVNQNSDLSLTDRNDQLEEILATESAPEAQAYAERVADASETAVVAEQNAILAEAATLREESEVSIPVFWGSAVMVAQPRVQGLELHTQSERYYFKDIWVDDGAA
ncbi:peptide ABC transporter substrate-binding protein [Ruania zhangjianzhongii]|uniref:peptide ABC transporter substrate-binding protein n=1 Tax=Ruania zhangjianzhongii TaxID=2603206 RepID=UPI0011C7062A|nr:peptide ABC transporter substrate-binding protein [Ruania zhangjianzhongii]